jgi:hypothetical protein
MSNTSREHFRNLHNEAMDLVVFARLGYDPRDKDRVYTEANKMRDFEKALEMESQAIALAQARFDQTQDGSDKLTESIYSRSAAWTSIQAAQFDEAEKIALTALARGAHPAEKAKLLDVLFTATKKQGYRLSSFEEEKDESLDAEVVNAEERELVSV